MGALLINGEQYVWLEIPLHFDSHSTAALFRFVVRIALLHVVILFSSVGCTGRCCPQHLRGRKIGLSCQHKWRFRMRAVTRVRTVTPDIAQIIILTRVAVRNTRKWIL